MIFDTRSVQGELKFLGISLNDPKSKFPAKFPSGFYKTDLKLFDQKDDNILELQFIDHESRPKHP